jgi:hypothetical protein
MMSLRTNILLKKMGRHSHLYHYYLDKFIKVNKKGEAKSSVQPCKDVRKSKTNESIKITYLAKV